MSNRSDNIQIPEFTDDISDGEEPAVVNDNKKTNGKNNINEQGNNQNTQENNQLFIPNNGNENNIQSDSPKVNEINKWEPTFPEEEAFRMLVVGKSGTGKTYLVQHLFNEYFGEKFDFVFVISMSEVSLDEYKEGLQLSEGTELLLYKAYFNEIGEALNKRIEMIHEMFKKEYNYQCKTLIIIDDALNITKDRYNKEMINLWTNGRKRFISAIFVAQALKFIDQAWKDNTNYFISFNILNALSRKKFIETVLDGAAGLDKKQLEKIFLKYAIGRQALVIDQTSNTNELNKILKYYSVE